MSIQTDYRILALIRRFEETVLAEFSSGAFYGTTHTCLGQEANAVGVLGQIAPGDIVVSNHRCHGHFLAYGGDPRALFAELMGKASGVCGGRGGSQHIHWRNFYSNGVLGSTIPLAVGMALAEKRLGGGAIAVAFLGDGAMGEGIVYESLNFASLWKAPILFAVENNHIAQTTPTRLALAGEIAPRFTGFGIPVLELDSSDVLEIAPTAQRLLDEIRSEPAPRALILNTERFGPHSKGDDTRPEDLLARIRSQRDPLEILGARLDPALRAVINAEVATQISSAFQQALADPDPVLNAYF
ncbi:MAG TPA: thiamine pyrophosphate-dependent dehydrogenase E1 component subunit alpha [Anaerolineaceae bacterium]|nr:thiamine pyrophosphate-dependent dehydrogenase E1 component subunit alpha [Anaerolineaceae bacterium]